MTPAWVEAWAGSVLYGVTQLNLNCSSSSDFFLELSELDRDGKLQRVTDEQMWIITVKKTQKLVMQNKNKERKFVVSSFASERALCHPRAACLNWFTHH